LRGSSAELREEVASKKLQIGADGLGQIQFRLALPALGEGDRNFDDAHAPGKREQHDLSLKKHNRRSGNEAAECRGAIAATKQPIDRLHRPSPPSVYLCISPPGTSRDQMAMSAFLPSSIQEPIQLPRQLAQVGIHGNDAIGVLRIPHRSPT
jgi:hypothetical protein